MGLPSDDSSPNLPSELCVGSAEHLSAGLIATHDSRGPLPLRSRETSTACPNCAGSFRAMLGRATSGSETSVSRSKRTTTPIPVIHGCGMLSVRVEEIPDRITVEMTYPPICECLKLGSGKSLSVLVGLILRGTSPVHTCLLQWEPLLIGSYETREIQGRRS
jgi:hypothetical protein